MFPQMQTGNNVGSMPAMLRESSVTAWSKHGTMNRKLKRKAGLSLTELLCVIAIMLILAALYLPAIARAYKRIRSFLEGF